MAIILPVTLCAILGWIASRHDDRDRAWLIVAGFLGIEMAMERGFYWNLFGRGVGYWTANRTTALIVMIGLLVGPMLWKKYYRG